MSFHLSPRPGAETSFSFRGPVVSVRELQWPRRRAIGGTARRVHPCLGCSWFSPPTPRSAGCTEGLSRPPTRLAEEEEFDATVKTKAHRAPEPGPRFPARHPTARWALRSSWRESPQTHPHPRRQEERWHNSGPQVDTRQGEGSEVQVTEEPFWGAWTQVLSGPAEPHGEAGDDQGAGVAHQAESCAGPGCGGPGPPR